MHHAPPCSHVTSNRFWRLRSRPTFGRVAKARDQGPIAVATLPNTGYAPGPPGSAVTREEIRQKLWSENTFVDFDQSLGTAINKIREVLNDSATAPRFLETLPRRGYRFIAPVTAVEPVKTGRKNRIAYAVVGPCVAVALLAAALIAENFHGWRDGLLSKLSPQPPVRSVAVLPLLNLSSDPEQQFFADGMTDELITNLAQISSLRVISHTSAMAYLGTHKPAAEIARELGVDALVEGSVIRSGSGVRITAQLIQAESDRHLWARSYNRELGDVLTLQREVAREIAENISIRLTPQEQAQLSRAHPVNPDVALLYFKGSYFLSQLDTPRAKEIFTEEFTWTRTGGGRGEGLGIRYIPWVSRVTTKLLTRPEDAANKALEIENSEAKALMVLGNFLP